MDIPPLLAGEKVIGAKQTLKAIEHQKAVVVYLAQDADDKVTIPIKEACLLNNIEIIVVDTKVKLGKQCGLTVGAAACAVLK